MESNAATQIRWGLTYIQDTYGFSYDKGPKGLTEPPKKEEE